MMQVLLPFYQFTWTLQQKSMENVYNLMTLSKDRRTFAKLP